MPWHRRGQRRIGASDGATTKAMGSGETCQWKEDAPLLGKDSQCKMCFSRYWSSAFAWWRDPGVVAHAEAQTSEEEERHYQPDPSVDARACSDGQWRSQESNLGGASKF
jgi:hypothetical protein